MSSPSDLPVVIVGAGISGLLTAQELKKVGIRVLVLEAAPVAGGRLLPSHALPKLKERGFYSGCFKGDFDLQKEDPIDMGGELIHGDGTELFKFAAQNDWKVRHVITWAQGDGETFPVGRGESFYWLGREKRLVSSLRDVPAHVAQANHLVGGLYKLDSNPDDGKTTVQDYLLSKGVAPNGTAMNLIDAGYANTYCSTLRNIKLRDTINCEKGFANDGEGEFRMGESGHCLSSRIFATLLQGVDVRYNCWVAQINYPSGNDAIQLITRDGETILASRVVVTVSPPLMQQIYFFPPLPLPKRNAIDSIKIENAMKVILFFKHRFWPEFYQGIVCSDSVVPEIWFDGNHYHPGILMDAKTKTVITESEEIPQERKISRAVGFCCSQFADYLRSLPEEEAANKFKAQLNEIFGTPEEPEPASKYCIGFAVFCWGDMPNIRGGYTSPNITEETRLDLGMPVDDKLFFAGEATSFPTFTAAHCAMETAFRVSKEVVQSIASKQKARL